MQSPWQPANNLVRSKLHLTCKLQPDRLGHFIRCNVQIAHNYSVFDAQFHGKNLVALKTDHKFSMKSVEYQFKTYRFQIPVSEFIGIDTFCDNFCPRMEKQSPYSPKHPKLTAVKQKSCYHSNHNARILAPLPESVVLVSVTIPESYTKIGEKNLFCI